ncbi:hypothetical protein FQA39_LY19274 [Lamprigera yunnana]|nr:hypothetical protein FQA39_LY19274 [Lamprigera yunnana]
MCQAVPHPLLHTQSGMAGSQFAPASGKQGGGRVAGDFHGDQVGQGADAAAALVDHGLWVAAGQQGVEFGAQRGGGFEVAVGPSLLYPALAAAEALNATAANMRWAKPLDVDLLRTLAQTHDALVTVEDGTTMGGAGSAVIEALPRKPSKSHAGAAAGPEGRVHRTRRPGQTCWACKGCDGRRHFSAAIRRSALGAGNWLCGQCAASALLHIGVKERTKARNKKHEQKHEQSLVNAPGFFLEKTAACACGK